MRPAKLLCRTQRTKPYSWDCPAQFGTCDHPNCHNKLQIIYKFFPGFNSSYNRLGRLEYGFRHERWPELG
jgi:hypothetical protein